jgi:hypothetical protein
MRMVGFWAVLDLVGLEFIYFLVWKYFICSVHSEAFLQTAGLKSVVLQGLPCYIAVRTYMYIITDEAGSRAGLQIADRYYRAALAALYPSTFPTSHFRLIIVVDAQCVWGHAISNRHSLARLSDYRPA